MTRCLPHWQPPVAKPFAVACAAHAETHRKLARAIQRQCERESRRIADALRLADLPREDYADLRARAEHARLTCGIDAMVCAPVGYERADLVLDALRYLEVP